MAPFQFNVDIEESRRAAGISLLRLSELTNIPRTSLRRKIAHPGTLSLDEMAALTRTLDLPEDAFGVTK